MNVASDDALARHARGLFRGRRNPALAQNNLRLRQIALGLVERALAFHHARAGPVAEFFYKLRTDLHKLAGSLVFLVPSREPVRQLTGASRAAEATPTRPMLRTKWSRARLALPMPGSYAAATWTANL